jgi:hypothetical protein
MLKGFCTVAFFALTLVPAAAADLMPYDNGYYRGQPPYGPSDDHPDSGPAPYAGLLKTVPPHPPKTPTDFPRIVMSRCRPLG